MLVPKMLNAKQGNNMTYFQVFGTTQKVSSTELPHTNVMRIGHEFFRIPSTAQTPFAVPHILMYFGYCKGIIF